MNRNIHSYDYVTIIRSIFSIYMIMSNSESLPKEFEKITEVLPFTKYGLSLSLEFREAEEELSKLEKLKNADLTPEEIKLYHDNRKGTLEQHKICGQEALKKKLEIIEEKIAIHNRQCKRLSEQPEKPSTSKTGLIERLQNNPLKFYPEGHPMNQIKELEDTLFGHLNTELLPLSKRRKILRRFERKKERILAQNKLIIPTETNVDKVDRPGSLWDLKDIPVRRSKVRMRPKEKFTGPKKPTMYTVKNDKIVRLEPVNQEENVDDFRAVDIVMPINLAEAQLLEGTKMSIDDIRKIDRFKNYEPGIPSKVLYLKNIAPSVTQEQISVLFNQFVLDNGGPIDVRLMSGRMRGQAFVSFHNENVAIQSLEEINGTIVSGRPIIAEFGRHTNRIQPEEE